MSDLPKDDVPGAPAQPDTETTRTERWKPATDVGSESETKPEDPSAASPPRKATAEPVADEPDAPTPPGERIAKAMARAGIASRRDAEAMILAGRVSVNGETLTSPARNVTDDDTILIDGERMPARERSRLWIFHKPRGLVTTARDPEGRQTVFEVLPEDLPRVVAVGRLDINTEGLLLLTNDGGLAKVIAHPDTGWLRRYRVRAHGDTDQAQLDTLAKGVTIDGMEYGPIDATLDRVQGDNLWLTLGLREGKNREVKRILEHLGLSVNRLIRLSFGPFQLGDLEVGLVEEVRMRVLKDQLGKALAEQAGVDFESPVREPIGAFGSPKKAEKSERAPSAGRNAARPAPAPRVSTGGAGSGPRKSAWRADEDSGKPHAARVPRRGADPRASQAAAAERGHERVGSFQKGDRRVVVERLSASPAAPAVEEKPRRRYADRGAPEGGQRSVAGRPDRESWGNRGASPRGDRGAGDRPSYGDRSGPRESARGASGPRDEARRDDRRDARPGGRGDRPYGAGSGEGAPRGQSGFRGERSGEGAPRGQSGFRGERSGGGGKPAFGGPKPGGGARPGGRPGGFAGKSASGFAGKGPGAKPGGRPGGFKGGGKPGGARPGGGGGGGGGGGRPPRAR
ncbi:pseudouridine synthase [Methylobacterium sp. J-072]|uniref:pseudouridine synthase n=1 Tax=Methylobacterium sp. J-072 TaxID=2836651 RepID=UPI001FB9B7B8|nr:pseudouridine synthase [Methylobacterium sp. J-072]MCJ2091593.1 pseudouridine synthase [Methylobacterium sp. J-072]